LDGADERYLLSGEDDMRYPKKALSVALVASALAATACDSFLDVTNPGTLEANAIDPVRDGELISRSAIQNLINAFGNLVINSAWFTNEARVGDTFPTRNEFGRRDIAGGNGTHSGENWNDLQTAIATGEDAIHVLEEAGGFNAGRSFWVAGFGILIQAELFCEGTVKRDLAEPGSRMTTDELLDMAIERLTQARQVLGTVSGSDASNMARAALVGIARAHLFAGRKAEAIAAAQQVPADFVYNFWHVDDPANRGRLGNNVWNFSESRLSLVVGPEYRAMADAGDSRIAYVDMNRVAQDGELRFYRQDKVKGWADPLRFASGLEARYIVLEAQGDLNAMVTFINQRRAVGKQPTFSSTNADEIWREFFDQHTRDFWLEAKRMPAWRRNLDRMPYIIPPGDNYYKDNLGLVSDQTCWIVPNSEIENNKNW
jgi:hypothetical protein